MKAHAQKPELVFLRNGRVHLNRRGGQFSRLLAAEKCGWRMQDYWLPTPFASFPFTSPPVRHRVPSHSDSALPRNMVAPSRYCFLQRTQSALPVCAVELCHCQQYRSTAWFKIILLWRNFCRRQQYDVLRSSCKVPDSFDRFQPILFFSPSTDLRGSPQDIISGKSVQWGPLFDRCGQTDGWNDSNRRLFAKICTRLEKKRVSWWKLTLEGTILPRSVRANCRYSRLIGATSDKAHLQLPRCAWGLSTVWMSGLKTWWYFGGVLQENVRLMRLVRWRFCIIGIQLSQIGTRCKRFLTCGPIFKYLSNPKIWGPSDYWIYLCLVETSDFLILLITGDSRVHRFVFAIEYDSVLLSIFR